jgi:hypothetical protein
MLSDHYDEVQFAGDKEYFGDLAVYIRRTVNYNKWATVI